MLALPVGRTPRIGLATLLPALLALGCATSGPSGDGGFYRYFEPAASKGDYWYPKVDEWQGRERRDRPTETDGVAELMETKGPKTGLLSVKMGRWASEERLVLAKRIAAWAQEEARRHYRFDPLEDAANDPWPTTKDLLDRNGDDCDGLDLIVYEILREFGFPERQLYRAIVRRNRDRANHMVTLWFDETDDPWVIDATGAVTLHVRRFSTLPGWTPTKLFNEHVQYSPMVKKGFASR